MIAINERQTHRLVHSLNQVYALPFNCLLPLNAPQPQFPVAIPDFASVTPAGIRKHVYALINSRFMFLI